MRIILDTNVLSVAIARKSSLYPIWQAFRNGNYDLLVTTDILDEYAGIIAGDLSPEVAEFVLNTIETLPNVIYIRKYFFWNFIHADPDDNKFVDAAIAANADYIVTDDRHFRVLKKIAFPKVNVISANDFLAIVLKKNTPSVK